MKQISIDDYEKQKKDVERQQYDLNTIINYMRDLCKFYNTCTECPMNHNCNEPPSHWTNIER